MRSAAVLSIIRDGETIRKVPVEGEALLGRAEGCLIRLDDRAISRQHALFKAVGDGVQVERKSAYAPLVVNGEECTRAVLKEGDVIALGPYLVKLSISRARSDQGARANDEQGARANPEQGESGKVTHPAASASGPRPLTAIPGGVSSGAAAATPQSTVPLPPTGGQSAAAALAAFTAAAGAGVPPAPPVATANAAPAVGGAFELGGGTAPPSESSGPLPFTPPGGPDAEIDLGPMGGLELAENGGEGLPGLGAGAGGLPLPGAPMDAPAFALSEASLSGESGGVDPDGETKGLPVSDLRARLVLKTGSAPKREYDLKKAEISIGRGKDCDIVLDDKKVSRRNTVIAKSGNRYVIRDLGSANGTYVNGHAISEEPLFGEDIVRIGNEEFEFQALSDSYARREKDFLAVTKGSMVVPPGGLALAGDNGPDISLPPPIGDPGRGQGQQLSGMEAGPAELLVPPDLRSPDDGQPVLFAVSPANMIPMGSGVLQGPPTGGPPSDAFAGVAVGNPAHANPGALATMGQMQTNAAGAIPGFGDPVANPLGIPGLTGIPGGQAQPKSILARINNLPPRRRFIAIGMILAVLYLAFFDDDEAPEVKGHKPKTPVATASAVPTATTASFDSLSPEKKQFVEAQHQLAFDHYRNQEFEKALHEVQKIFDIIPDYKDSREIERYAKEGLRKQEAQEEERRRKQDELVRKQQIEQLLNQIRDRMAKKDYASARELFARVIELDPENQAIAQWKKQIDDWEEQLRIKQQEKEVQDQINQRAWDIFKEGMALKKQGKYHAAIATFARVADVGASDRRVLVSARTAIGNCKAIIKARRDPVLKAAHAAEDGGEYKKALDLYEKATKIDPPHPEGWVGLSRVKQIIHDRAKVTYTEAVLAESYSDFDTARKKYQEIADTAPKDDDYHGRALRKLEKYIGLRGLAGGDSGGDAAAPAPAGGGGAGGGSAAPPPGGAPQQ